ncbi:MAG: tetratricopeptide repeat protein [bacterium]
MKDKYRSSEINITAVPALILTTIAVLLLVRWWKSSPPHSPEKMAKIMATLEKTTSNKRKWQALEQVREKPDQQKKAAAEISAYFSLDDLLEVVKKSGRSVDSGNIKEGVSAFSEGTLDLREGEKEKSRFRIARAIRKLRAARKTLPGLETSFNLGWAHYLYGNNQEAYRNLKAAEGYAQENVSSSAGNTIRGKGNIYGTLDYLLQNALGLTKIMQGDMGAALDHFHEGLALAKENRNTTWTGIISRNIGKAFLSQDKKEIARTYLKEALSSDVRGGYVRGQVLDCLLLAKISRQEAKGLYHRSLELLKRFPVPALEGDIYLIIGNLALQEKRYQEAVSLLQQSLIKYISVHHKIKQAEVFSQLASAYKGMGNLENALRYSQEALMLYNEIVSRDYRATDLNDIGLVYYSEGDLSAAVNYYQGVLAVYLEGSDKKGAAIVLGNIAKIYLDKHKPREALKFLDRALLLDKEINFTQGLGIHFAIQGLTYLKMKEKNKALVCLNKAWSVFKKESNSAGKALLYTHLGNVFLNEKEFEKALKNYKSAKDVYAELEDFAGEAKVLYKMGTVYFIKKEIPRSLKYFEESDRKYEELVSDFPYKKPASAFSKNIIVPD